MYPILVDWGPLFLPAWHVFFALGAIATYFLVQALNRATGSVVPFEALNRLYVMCYLAGYLGARGLNIFLAESPDGLFDFVSRMGELGGMVFYGGFLAAVAVGWAEATRLQLVKPALFDLAMPSVMLGLALGRIGCFLNGDDYGVAASHASWATVVFPNLEDGLPRYPVQLWESALAFALSAWGVRLLKKNAQVGSGRIGLILLIGYAIGRFCIEFFRDDERGWVFAPWLSTSQFISILLLCGAVLLLLRPHTQTVQST